MNFLDKFNPKTSLFDNFQIDEDLSVEQRAFDTYKALVSAKRSHDGLFLVIGKLLKDVRDDKLYEKLDYDTFSQFLASEELSFSREKAYMCIKTFEYYIEYLELDPESVGKMNISRLSMMVPILKKIDDKEEVIRQIEELGSLRHGDFVRQVKEKSNKNGKPEIYYSEERERWIINYYEDTTHLISHGNFKDQEA